MGQKNREVKNSYLVRTNTTIHQGTKKGKKFFGTPSLEQADDSAFSPTTDDLTENVQTNRDANVDYDDQYKNAYQDNGHDANEYDGNTYERKNYNANDYNGNRYKEGYDTDNFDG